MSIRKKPKVANSVGNEGAIAINERIRGRFEKFKFLAKVALESAVILRLGKFRGALLILFFL